MEKNRFIFSDDWQYRLQRHAAFWIFWWIFQGLLYSVIGVNSFPVYVKRLPIAMFESFIYMFNHMFLAYSLMYFVVPRYFLRQRYWQTGVITIVLFLLTACTAALSGRFILDPIILTLVDNKYVPEVVRTIPISMHRSLLAGLRGGITIGGIAAAIKLMKHWYVKEQRNLQLQKENVESRLQLLKAQVHPHFLFNTLNNIYAYTQDTAPVASRLITRLSGLLRFILYESGQPLVPLSGELQMIQDYTDLEKVRYGNKLALHVNVPHNTNDLHIAPLLLLPLIENCFKHGTSHVLEQPWINLEVVVNGKEMQMKLMNGKASSNPGANENGGIGLQNVRARLELLYSGRHQLRITNEEDVFIVDLRIELEQQKIIPTKSSTNQQQLVHA